MLKKLQKLITITVLTFVVTVVFTFLNLTLLSKNYIMADLNAIEAKGHNISEVKTKLEIIQLAIVGFSAVFVIGGLVLGRNLSKFVFKPTMELVKNAEAIIRGQETRYIPLKSNPNNDQIDDLVSMIVEMDQNIKENLEETTKQKNEIETILLHMRDGVISFDIHGKISHINRAAVEALNVDKQDTFYTICQKMNIELSMEKLIYMDKITPQDKIIEIREKTYKVFFAPLKTEEDKAYGIAVILTNITETVELDLMRKRFVADVSHELKTPITSILGYSETIIEDAQYSDVIDKEQTIYFVNKINKEASRMSELVQDLLTLSKYDSKSKGRMKESFKLTKLVKELVERFKETANYKKIEMKCYITAEVPNIYADKFGIERVITNILTNAIKYTPEGGNIDIYIGFLYKDVYVKIKDTGIGISKKDLEKVFERFYRVDSSRVRQSGGTGLGLSIAKEILDKNNGKIDISSSLGQGTEVVLRFPAKRKNTEE